MVSRPGYYTLIVADIAKTHLLCHLDTYHLKYSRAVLAVEHDPALENLENEQHIGCTEYPTLHWHLMIAYDIERWDNDTELTEFRTKLKTAGAKLKGQKV